MVQVHLGFGEFGGEVSGLAGGVRRTKVVNMWFVCLLIAVARIACTGEMANLGKVPAGTEVTVAWLPS